MIGEEEVSRALNEVLGPGPEETWEEWRTEARAAISAHLAALEAAGWVLRHLGRKTRMDFCNRGHSLSNAFEYNGKLQCRECARMRVRSRRAITRQKRDLQQMIVQILMAASPARCDEDH